jgi:hypothetical protein
VHDLGKLGGIRRREVIAGTIFLELLEVWLPAGQADQGDLP